MGDTEDGRMHLYWGDVHNHCGISYGYGSLENALIAARTQLDFCAVTGHANWHDIPPWTEELAYLIGYHKRGFEKLADAWDRVRATIEAANSPGEFVTFQSYEAHSREYGDHHILSPSPDLPLVEGASPSDLVSQLGTVPAIAIPHHIAYAPGYRGINWEAYTPAISPVVEVYSKHGCGLSDRSPYPYLHTMGPRDSRNTVRAGMRLGHHFGFVASTDHHAGYPGSYGDGRLAVLAQENTRQAIWDALLARRTYAITGDKIACRFRVNGAVMGSDLDDPGTREIALDVVACDTLDKIIVYKNAIPWKVVCGECIRSAATSQRFKVRVEMGWGGSDEAFAWGGGVAVQDGTIAGVETCFRGQSVLAPSRHRAQDPDINALGNRIIGQSPTDVEWECTSFRNPSTLHPQTQAIVLEIEGDPAATLRIHLGGKELTRSIGELLRGSLAVQLKDYNAESYLVHRAIPEAQYRLHFAWSDAEREDARDVYDVEIRQTNGQCAWLSPSAVRS